MGVGSVPHRAVANRGLLRNKKHPPTDIHVVLRIPSYSEPRR